MNTLIPLDVFPQHVPLAIVLVVCASMLFASGAAIQHLAIGRRVDKTAANRSMGFRQVLSLLRDKTWLIGLGISLVGGVTHIAGIALAPVTVVQPVGVLAVPWSVVLSMRIYGHRPPGKLWIGVGVTILGVIGFTTISANTAAPDSQFDGWHVMTAAFVGVIFSFALAGLGRYGTPKWRCLSWAVGGSLLYGVSAALIKVVTEMVGTHTFLTQPLFWFALCMWGAGYLVGGWMVQQAYANGPAEVVVAAMTTVDPMVAVSFGLAVLGEGVRIDRLAGLGLLFAGGIALLGVVSLAQEHPEVTRKRRAAQE